MSSDLLEFSREPILACMARTCLKSESILICSNFELVTSEEYWLFLSAEFLFASSKKEDHTFSCIQTFLW